MTCISYTNCYDRYILECTGHTDYGNAGSDILCSAVSVLCLTCDAYLSKAYAEGIISNYDSRITSGYAYISFSCDEESPAISCMEALTEGFRMLSDNFPENISYEE